MLKKNVLHDFKHMVLSNAKWDTLMVIRLGSESEAYFVFAVLCALDPVFPTACVIHRRMTPDENNRNEKKHTHEHDVHYITFELNIDLVASSFDFLALIDLSRIRFFFMRRNAAKTLNGTNTWDEDYMKEERWNVGPRQYQSQQAHTGRDTLHLLAASCCWSRHRRRCSGYFFSSSLLLCLLVSLGFWSCFRCMSGSCWRFTIFRTLTTAARTYSFALRSTLHRAHPIQTDSKRKC